MVYRRTAAVTARQERTRAAIVDAARSLIASHGLAGTAVADVAAVAGVGVGTVYRHFPSKVDLLTMVVDDVCRHELDIVAAVAADTAASPTERLVATVSVFVTRALRGGRTAFAMIGEPAERDVERRRLAVRSQLAGLFASVVAEGVADGTFPEQHPPTTGAAIVGAVSEVLLRPLGDQLDDRVEIAEVVAGLTGFVLGAVITPIEPVEVALLERRDS